MPVNYSGRVSLMHTAEIEQRTVIHQYLRSEITLVYYGLHTVQLLYRHSREIGQ